MWPQTPKSLHGSLWDRPGKKIVEKLRFFDVKQLKRAEQGDEPIKLQWKEHLILFRAQFEIIYMLIVRSISKTATRYSCKKIAFQNLISSKKIMKKWSPGRQFQKRSLQQDFSATSQNVIRGKSNCAKVPTKMKVIEQWRKFRVDVVYFVRREFDYAILTFVKITSWNLPR